MTSAANKFSFAGAVCVALSVVIASAQGPAPKPISRDAAIQISIENNRELKVASLEIERARARLRWAGLLPNPELEVAASDDFIGNNDRENSVEIAFTQRFPVTSRLNDEKVLRREQVELAQIEFTVRQRQLAAEVDKAWLALSAAKNLVELQRRLLGLNQEIVTFLSGRAKVGEASSLDVNQAELNGKQIEQKVSISQSAVVTADGKLKQLVGVDQSENLTIAESLALPSGGPAQAVSFKEALENRPDFVALLFKAEVGEAKLELAIAQRWEDIEVKVFLATENSVDDPEGLDRNNFAGIGFSIPLPLRNKNQEAIEQARIDLEEVRRVRAVKAFAIRSELQVALKARDNAYKLAVQAGGELLELAKRNFEEFKKAQQIGQANLLQVQQAQQRMLELETTAVDMRSSYFQADAEVRFIAGLYPIPKVRASSK
jgi:cobalt-zinc-cadmium efflux system outer membrane protein